MQVSDVTQQGLINWENSSQKLVLLIKQFPSGINIFLNIESWLEQINLFGSKTENEWHIKHD